MARIWTPPAERPAIVDRKPPSLAAGYAAIPDFLDYLRPDYAGHTMLGVLVTARDTGITYRVDAESPYVPGPYTMSDTPGTYTLTAVANSKTTVAHIKTVAELASTEPVADRQRATIAGFSDSEDRGGGVWRADLTDTTTAADGYTTIRTVGGKLWRNLRAIKRRVTPEMFDTSGSFVAGWTRAMAFLMAAGGGVLLLGAKTYVVDPAISAQDGNYLTQFLLPLAPANLVIEGAGSGQTVLQYPDNVATRLTDSAAVAHLFQRVGQFQNIAFKGLSFNLRGAQNLTPAGLPSGSVRSSMLLRVDSAGYNGNGNVHFDDVEVRDCHGHNVVSLNGNGDGVTSKRLRIWNGGQCMSGGVANPNNADYSAFYSTWTNTRLEIRVVNEYPDISMLNACGGVELHASNSSVTNSYFEGCRPAVYVVSAPYTTENIHIGSGTVMNKCMEGVDFWQLYPLRNVIIAGLQIKLYIPPTLDARYVRSFGIGQQNNGGAVTNPTVNGVAYTGTFYDFRARSNLQTPIEGLYVSTTVIGSSHAPGPVLDSNGVPYNMYGLYLNSINKGRIDVEVENMNGPAAYLSRSPFGLTDVQLNLTATDCAQGMSTTSLRSALLWDNVGQGQSIVTVGNPTYASGETAGSRDVVVNNFARDVRINIVAKNTTSDLTNTAGAITGAKSAVQVTSGAGVMAQAAFVDLLSTANLEHIEFAEIRTVNVGRRILGTASPDVLESVHPHVHLRPRQRISTVQPPSNMQLHLYDTLALPDGTRQTVSSPGWYTGRPPRRHGERHQRQRRHHRQQQRRPAARHVPDHPERQRAWGHQVRVRPEHQRPAGHTRIGLREHVRGKRLDGQSAGDLAHRHTGHVFQHGRRHHPSRRQSGSDRVPQPERGLDHPSGHRTGHVRRAAHDDLRQQRHLHLQTEPGDDEWPAECGRHPRTAGHGHGAVERQCVG
ncbi:hypothetical protein MF271_19300 (plasmid) [Deinococcus sp. KNUC1210]|uniref:hypothetical protein n=1 Tax=Deinococcus sp. KNUC1210 TaxID=2917691 RepID=UPI001EEFDF0C|nr:hypothetical protein [Deinococcus sp. KNUC1210]ULH17338.1 hypothetical protein MF271_19300 [Deinococcus sp. KNUC1210]